MDAARCSWILRFLAAPVVLAAMPAVGFAQVTEEWVAVSDVSPTGSHDLPVDLALDPGGNVFVTGRATNGIAVKDYDIFTLKYSSQGQLLWVDIHDGVDGVDDEGRAVIVDAAGNAYVTGYVDGDRDSGGGDLITLKYSPDGVLLWTDVYTEHAKSIGRLIELTPGGGVHVVGGVTFVGHLSTDAFLTIRYAPDGTRLWLRLSDEATGSQYNLDSATGLAVDAEGSAYVTGGTEHPSPQNIVARTVKYDANGKEVWNVEFNASSSADWPQVLRLAPDGSALYVGGENGYIAGGDRVFVIRYDPDTGTEEWVEVLNIGFGESIASMVVDAAGRVCFTGSATFGNSTDMYTRLLDPAGTELWTSFVSHPGVIEDQPGMVTADAGGNFYVTGKVGSTFIGTADNDFVTVKYAPDGQELWRVFYDAFHESAFRVELDAEKYIYVTGVQTSYPASGFLRTLTIKYSQAEPPTCQPDLGFGGPGTLALSLCGEPLASGASAELLMSGAEPSAPLLLLASTSGEPVPLLGGTIVPASPAFVLVLGADEEGVLRLQVPGGAGPLTVFVQGLMPEPSLPASVAISNALEVELLP